MDKLSPAEVILFRAECFKALDAHGVYSLYAKQSEMCRLFTAESFSSHFKLLTKNNEHAGVKIVAENIKHYLAEVKYIEHINEDGSLTTYYSKTVLTSEDGFWRILKEKREKHTVPE